MPPYTIDLTGEDGEEADGAELSRLSEQQRMARCPSAELQFLEAMYQDLWDRVTNIRRRAVRNLGPCFQLRMNRPTFGRLLQALRGIDIGHIVPGLVEPYMEEVDRDLGTFEPMLALTPRFANQMLGDVINTNSPLDIVTLALVAIREAWTVPTTACPCCVYDYSLPVQQRPNVFVNCLQFGGMSENIFVNDCGPLFLRECCANCVLGRRACRDMPSVDVVHQEQLPKWHEHRHLAREVGYENVWETLGGDRVR